MTNEQHLAGLCVGAMPARRAFATEVKNPHKPTVLEMALDSASMGQPDRGQVSGAVMAAVEKRCEAEGLSYHWQRRLGLYRFRAYSMSSAYTRVDECNASGDTRLECALKALLHFLTREVH